MYSLLCTKHVMTFTRKHPQRVRHGGTVLFLGVYLVVTVYSFVQEVNRKVQGSSTRVSVKGHDPNKGDILRGFRVVDRAEYDEAMGRVEYDEVDE